MNEESGGVIQVYSFDVDAGTLTPSQTIACTESGETASAGTAEMSVGPSGAHQFCTWPTAGRAQ